MHVLQLALVASESAKYLKEPEFINVPTLNILSVFGIFGVYQYIVFV